MEGHCHGDGLIGSEIDCCRRLALGAGHESAPMLGRCQARSLSDSVATRLPTPAVVWQDITMFAVPEQNSSDRTSYQKYERGEVLFVVTRKRLGTN